MTESSSSAVTKLRGMFSTSCAATLFMAFYVVTASLNLYGLMFPLAYLDLKAIPENQFVKPLWETQSNLHMKVYLSVKEQFDSSFLEAEFRTEDPAQQQPTDDQDSKINHHRPTVLLWNQDISAPSLSKSFLLTSLDCDPTTENTCGQDDKSYQLATSWLDHTEQLSTDGGDILSTIKAAGHGMESTSVLLTFYQSLSKHLWNLLTWLGIADKNDKHKVSNTNDGVLPRSTIHLPSKSHLWSFLMNNSTVYVHVLVMKQSNVPLPHPVTLEGLTNQIGRASRTHSLLLGQVGLVKYDEPNHLSKPGRILYHDLAYLFQKYVLLQDTSHRQPPWDMQYAKPEYYHAYQSLQDIKQRKAGYPYWKPEVAVKYLIDHDAYPYDWAHRSGMTLVRVQPSQMHPTGIAHIPALYVDEIGLTSEKYIPINSTVTTLPLHITFDRSDMKPNTTTHHAATATAGGISPARWRLLTHLSQSIESQKQFGFEQSDIDDLRRLIADTNVTLLGITMLASALHLLFEFLTFKSEVSFWRNNTDLTGLSVRSLFLDMMGQFIIVLFLIEKDSSLLMTIPSALGCLIALWKCQRAAGLRMVKISSTDRKQQGSVSWWNILPQMCGYEIRATRLELIHQQQQQSPTAPLPSSSSSADKHKNDTKKTNDDKTLAQPLSPARRDLQALTIESDRIATRTLGTVLLPMVLAYTIYSLIMEEHVGWYSWLITSASSAVYALGFVLMTPQLFLNYKLKSVAHLPWRVMVYKTINTFIDDLFSFIIRMPTMARISCFRDDVVFFVYLYQRWLYPVDATRPVEGGGDGLEVNTRTATAVTETKKKQ